MTIDEIKTARRLLEDSISNQLIEFGKKTNTSISSVDINMYRDKPLAPADTVTVAIRLEI